MAYAQVITPGFTVVLDPGGSEYEYHTDTGKRVVLCEEASTMENPSGPYPVEPGLESLVELAKADLAQRLSISADQIDLLEARAVVWSNTALGCPQPGMRYRQIPEDGALIRFSAEGRTHSYHSGAGRGPFLCQQGTKGPPGSPQPDELVPPLGSEDA